MHTCGQAFSSVFVHLHEVCFWAKSWALNIQGWHSHKTVMDVQYCSLSLSSSLFMPHMEHMQRCIMGQWNWNVLALSLILRSSTYNLTSWYLSSSYFFLLCLSLLMKETVSAFQSYSAKKLVSCKKSNTYAARFDNFLALECRGVVCCEMGWGAVACEAKF